nr:immunoglobulin heavy chain junction region [Macaca mulatta]MOX91475.1 immunoglobulin heavy chain junction region [Macaca mulatta]MOX91490.1 immunoglobulin heavy chain junction region [Macaca mulatta]MOX91496.1 immunoglobulin heavy chain junction region [Macaca mulatta]MOX91554.1 immunoglobulin heavy chain junction region [Macaca mulatta]
CVRQGIAAGWALDSW